MSIRCCSWAGSACGTSGPPQVRRSSAWTTPCGWPVRRAHAPTRLCSSLRSAVICRCPATSTTAVVARPGPCPSRACCGRPGAGAAASSPGPAPAGRGCRGSPAPRRCRPPPGCRTPACRTGRGRTSPAPPAPRTASSPARRTPSPRGWRRRAGRPRATTMPSSSALRPVERVVALDLQLGREVQQRRHARAGRSTPSRRACGPARTGRPPARSTAASTPTSRRRRPPAAARPRPPTPSGRRPASAGRRPRTPRCAATRPRRPRGRRPAPRR